MLSSSSHIRSGRGAEREEVADQEGSGAWTDEGQEGSGGHVITTWVLNRPLQALQETELVAEGCLFYLNGCMHSSMHFYAFFNLYLAPSAQFCIIADKKAAVVSFVVPHLTPMQAARRCV